MQLEEGIANKDQESPESNLITAILATYFEDIRALRTKRQLAATNEHAFVMQQALDSLVNCAASEWTQYLCGLIEIDHDWFMEQIIACAAGHEPKKKTRDKRLSKWAVMPRTRRRGNR